ncbi:MAG: hypothetical protein ABL997_19315 [Planctomycetota bacterium]
MSDRTGSAANPRAPHSDTAIALFAALVLYAAMRQETFYSADGFGLLLAARKGDVMLPHHALYLPILALVRTMTGSLYGAASWLSVVGAAIGVAVSHAAFARLSWSRTSAALAAALVATAPAVVFFATVVELHGLHFGVCAFTWLAITWFERTPSAATGAALGAATAIGFLGHGTGLLLPVVALPVAAILAHERGAAASSVTRPLCLALLVHIAAVLGSNLALRTVEPAVSVEGAARFAIGEHGASVLAEPWLVLHAIGSDWLLPFFATSGLALVGLCVRGTRKLAMAVWFAVACYAAVTAVLVGGSTEHGAYLLPLVWPAALVAVRACPSARLVVVALIASLASAVFAVLEHDVGEDRGFVAGYRRVIAATPAILVVGSHREAAPLLLDEPEADWFAVVDVLPLEHGEAAPVWVESWVRATTQTGRDVLLTEGAVRWLGDRSPIGSGELGERLLSHLRATCAFEAVADGSFAAHRLRPHSLVAPVPAVSPR